jgi:hypothetical protein
VCVWTRRSWLRVGLNGSGFQIKTLSAVLIFPPSRLFCRTKLEENSNFFNHVPEQLTVSGQQPVVRLQLNTAGTIGFHLPSP